LNSIKFHSLNVAIKLILHYCVICILIVFLLPVSLPATPDYAEDTKQGCLICHFTEEGGALTEKGLEYSASGYVWPPEGGFRVLGPVRKSVRLAFGVLHIIASFMWFGTILYVHLILRPGYALKGLPRGEVTLGMISMTIVGITGVLLTISKIRSIDVLYSTPWGIILTIKIILYLIMISSALFVVLFLGPRLKEGIKKPVSFIPEIFDPESLSQFDGKEGRPSYISYKDKVYDMTGLQLWKNGVHMKHAAGHDMTHALSKAPHGEEKLVGLPVVSKFDGSRKAAKTSIQKAFYFIAYMNLVIVFCVLIVIAYWRWGFLNIYCY
jgi:predicted heme/steroid binding protein